MKSQDQLVQHVIDQLMKDEVLLKAAEQYTKQQTGVVLSEETEDTDLEEKYYVYFNYFLMTIITRALTKLVHKL